MPSFIPPHEIPDHTLLRRIGSGSFGEVWLARTITGYARAVKIVRRGQLGDAMAYEREFAAMRHYEPVSRRADGLVNVLHIGRAADDSFFYYVMELADHAGADDQAAAEDYTPRTLQSELEQRGALPLDEVLILALELARALKVLHEAGLTHRDIKPANIIYVRGTPKLADMGLVSTANDPAASAGTEGYMPPEGTGSPQADIFGLAMVLYQAVTGSDPAHFPEVPREWLKGCPREMAFFEIIARAGEHDINRRHADAKALLQSFADFAENSQRPPKRRAGILALVFVIFALIASAALWSLRSSHEPQILAEVPVKLQEPRSLILSPDEHLLAITSAEGIDFFSLPELRPLHRFREFPVSSIAFGSDQSTLFIAATSGPHTGLNRWALLHRENDLQLLQTGRLGPHVPCDEVATGAGGLSIAATFREPASHIACFRPLRESWQLPQSAGMKHLCISPDGTYLAAIATTGDLIRIWNLPAARPELELPHPGTLRLAFTPDSQHLRLSTATTITSYHLPGGEKESTVAGSSANESATAPMSGWQITLEAGRLRLWQGR